MSCGTQVKTIGGCVFNSGWVGECFGSDALEPLKNEAVICSGSTLGSFMGISHYVRTMLTHMDKVGTGGVSCVVISVPPQIGGPQGIDFSVVCNRFSAGGKISSLTRATRATCSTTTTSTLRRGRRKSSTRCVVFAVVLSMYLTSWLDADRAMEW